MTSSYWLPSSVPSLSRMEENGSMFASGMEWSPNGMLCSVIGLPSSADSGSFNPSVLRTSLTHACMSFMMCMPTPDSALTPLAFRERDSSTSPIRVSLAIPCFPSSTHSCTAVFGVPVFAETYDWLMTTASTALPFFASLPFSRLSTEPMSLPSDLMPPTLTPELDNALRA